MKNKSLILLIIGIVSLVLALLLSFIIVIYNNSSIVLNDRYKKVAIKVSSKKDKVLKLNLAEKSNILIDNTYLSNVDNDYIYILKNEKEKTLSTGILLNKEDSIIRNIDKGKYKIYISNNSKKKQKITFNIKRENVVSEDFAILEDGYNVNSKILEFAGKNDYNSNESIKRIKLAKEMNNKYKNNNHLVSDYNSKENIYLWVEDDTVYFYSKDKIAFGEFASDTFANLGSLIDIKDLKYFDFSNVKYASHLFFSDSSLSDIKAISYFDTSNVESVGGMFYGCHNLSDITPFISFSNAKLTDMDNLFYDTIVNDISIMKYFNVSNVKNLSSIFKDSGVTDISSLKNWNTKNANDISFMFAGTRIKNVDSLSNWDVSKVKNMMGLFYECAYLENIDGLKKWNTSSLENLSFAFSYNEFKDLDSLKNFKTNKLNDLNSTFSNMRELTDISGIKNWNVSKVSDFSHLFELTAINSTKSFEKWDVSKAEDFNNMFSHTKINNLNGLNKWNVINVKDFSEMFAYDNKLKDASDIDSWSVNGSTNDMFKNTKVKYPRWYN